MASNVNLCSRPDGNAPAVAEMLFDEGTFCETGKYVCHAPGESAGLPESEAEGVITGYGAVDGRPVFTFIQDFACSGAPMTSAHAKKICDLFDLALRNRAPVVGVFSSAGASVESGIRALTGYGAIMKKSAEASGFIPQIAVIDGKCGGLFSVLTSMFDFTVVTDKAEIYTTPSFLSDGKKPEADPACFTKAATDTSDAISWTRSLLGMIPSNNEEGTVCALSSGDGETWAVDTGAQVRALISSLSDNGQLFETAESEADDIVTAFIMLGDRSVGVVANDATANEGRITASGACKAAKFIDFCSAFGIPLLTLTDSAGFSAVNGYESAELSGCAAALAQAYTLSESSKVTVVTGKAYGAAFTLMGSKSIGADIAFALDTAQISILPPESAVEFLRADDIKNSGAPGEYRSELTEQWKRETASPVTAAASGEIDDVITAEQLRFKVATAFALLEV